MRKQLKEREGIRGVFTATFERYGSKPAFRGPRIRTLLFVAVKDTAGNVVADHVWFTQCKLWERPLEPGQRVMFTARVTTYRKGYRGRRDDDDLPAVTTDYRLSHPTDLRLLGLPSDPVGERDPSQLSLF